MVKSTGNGLVGKRPELLSKDEIGPLIIKTGHSSVRLKVWGWGPFPSSNTEKSSLWTDAGVDQNFQRDLGAIGPCDFQKKNSYGPIPWCLVFRENLYGPMALKVHQKFPRTGIGPWLALPNNRRKLARRLTMKHIR